jgi:inner membrane protein
LDNICHTLVGAALAQTGLKRRTGLATATLMIGANFPDIDGISIPFGRATEFRRGWTHGVLALVVLPFVLTAIMLAWHRYRRSIGQSVHRSIGPVVPRELLLLSAVSILTHPTLDWMNSYGLRWLMPFNGRWFYGDSLFIIDPWLWLVLGLGVWLSRWYERRGRPHAWRPARSALALAGAYIVCMLGLHAAAERVASRELAQGGEAIRRLIVTPMPADPVHWSVYADDGARYSRYVVSLAPGRMRRLSDWQPPIEKHADDPAAVEAGRTEQGRRFLNWARLPYYHVVKDVTGTNVEIIDARYGASVNVKLD